jgi:hypothetical protein
MRWPAIDAPADVKALGKKLIAVMEGYDPTTIGPAISVVFGYVVLELADKADDMSAVDRMMADVRALVLRHGAAKESYTQ